MFAPNHPTPFDFPESGRAPKLLPLVLPRMSESDLWPQPDFNRHSLQRTELPFYVLQSHTDFSETEQFSLSNFPQELQLDVPQVADAHPEFETFEDLSSDASATTFDSPTYDIPNSLPRSTAAEISWLRGNEQQDFLKEDIEFTPPPSNPKHTGFYFRDVESFPAASVIKNNSSKRDRACVKIPVRKAVDVELEEGVFPEVCLKIHSKYKKAENSSEFILKVKKEIRLPGNRKPAFSPLTAFSRVALPNLDGYKKVNKKHTPGKKPKLKARWTLMCNHCGKIFCARPTPKNSRYVVNHMCPMHGNKRKQFVIGIKARRCEKEHEGPCIQQLMKLNEGYEGLNESSVKL